jgi:hypothetical protein
MIRSAIRGAAPRLTPAPAAVLAAALLAAALPAPAAADVPHPTLSGIRPLGMGDAFVAVVDDRNALYYNPAGLARLTRTRLSGLGLHGGVDQEFLGVVDFIRENEDAFADFENVDPAFLDAVAEYDDKWVGADAAAYVDFTRPYLGLGVYSAGHVQVKVDRGVYEPRVFADVVDDIVAVAGGAIDLGTADLRVGAALKLIWRRQFDRALTAREVADFDAQTIADRLSGTDPGFAMDLGVLWAPAASPFRGGLVLRDAAGTIGGESVGVAFDLGGAWSPREDLTVAADLKDLNGGDGGLASRIHLGAEVRAPIVAFRAGFHQGYPALGLSLGVPVLSLDYAFYGRELGELPGAESQYLHAVEARLGF